MTRDVVHKGEDGKWYYWDETWSFEEGPYESREKCLEALYKYWKECLGMG